MANLDGHRLPDWLKQAEATGFPSLKAWSTASAKTSTPSPLDSPWNGTPVELRAT
jgi:hypothetical protein